MDYHVSDIVSIEMKCKEKKKICVCVCVIKLCQLREVWGRQELLIWLGSDLCWEHSLLSPHLIAFRLQSIRHEKLPPLIDPCLPIGSAYNAALKP